MKNFIKKSFVCGIVLLSVTAHVSAMGCFGSCCGYPFNKNVFAEVIPDHFDVDNYNIDPVYLCNLYAKEKHYLSIGKNYEDLLISIGGQYIYNKDLRKILKKINNILIGDCVNNAPLATLAALSDVCNGLSANVPEAYREILEKEELINNDGVVDCFIVAEVVKAAVKVIKDPTKKDKPTILMCTEDEIYENIKRRGDISVFEAEKIFGLGEK